MDRGDAIKSAILKSTGNCLPDMKKMSKRPSAAEKIAAKLGRAKK